MTNLECQRRRSKLRIRKTYKDNPITVQNSIDRVETKFQDLSIYWVQNMNAPASNNPIHSCPVRPDGNTLIISVIR